MTFRPTLRSAAPLAMGAVLLGGCTGGEDHNDADAMFAQMMVPHHQQAVTMSDLVLAKEDVQPEVRELAQQIKAAQGPEIEQLQTWMDEWAVKAAGHDQGMPMEGMLSDEQLKQLEDADGPEASQLFLDQMIGHHEGAITMAETELADGEHEGALEMAEAIVDTQQDEIDHMQDLLGQD